MNKERFKTIEELYQRVLPALRIKVKYMKLEKLALIDEKSLWDYFCNKKWRIQKSITLGEMIDDILNTDSFQIYHEMKGMFGRED
ncbi:MAG: hypothetical protein IJ772_00055 [Bacilli bacterium]|nr:hypothetical protein [Bacilli bacterium]